MAQIKKDTTLRKAILQAAITGQLISDVEGSTETGKELLDRIIEERNNKLLTEWEEALKKNPKAKKPAPVFASEIDEEEIPFEIPENWCWCRLGECVNDCYQGINTAGIHTKFVAFEGIPIIQTGDMSDGIINLSKTKLMSFSDYEIFKDKYQPQYNDIFYCNIGTIGKPLIYRENYTMLFHWNLFIFKYNQMLLLPEFLKIILEWITSYFQKNTDGTAMQFVSKKKIINAVIPLPPLPVQNAIVAKLEQVLPLVDAYENALLQKEELKTALPDKVKKAILQEAITGQLTESWRKSATIKECGKQLLDRIIEERNAKALAEWEEALKKNVGGKATLPSFASKTRAKKPVPVVLSEIEEEEIPFEVPENWCWCRLGDLGDFVRGSGIKRDETRPEGFPCIRYGEMYTRYKTVINETVSFVEKNVFDKCQKIIKNDIAMALTGENEYDIALAAVYTGDKEVAMGGDMTRFRPAFVNSLFLVFALNSPYGIECKSELATGNIIVHISNDKLGSIMIPLPPLEEQEEIVKKVEELLLLCK